MIRKNLIVFASGLALAIIALSTAWIIGGNALMLRIQKDGHFNSHNDGPGEAVVTRELDFDGARTLTIDTPVSLRFVRGPLARMTVSGPTSLMTGLKWENGALSTGGSSPIPDGTLEVTITGPQLAGLILRGAGDIDLQGLQQPALMLQVQGAADVEVTGRVDTLAITAQGVGSLDLAQVVAKDAKLDISGIGDVDISASHRVEADISGAGSVTLHQKPEILVSRNTGLGSIDHDY
jgi:hypothetical protein